jgi:hypothetical protein
MTRRLPPPKCGLTDNMTRLPSVGVSFVCRHFKLTDYRNGVSVSKGALAAEDELALTYVNRRAICMSGEGIAP